MKKIINKKNALYIIFFVIIILLISILGFLKVRNLYTNINEQSILNNSNEVNNDESINEQNKPNVSLDNTTSNSGNKQELKNDTSNKVNKNNKNNNVVNNSNKEDESDNNTTNDSNKEDESDNNTTNDPNKEDQSNNNTTNDSNKEDESNNNTTNDSNKENESNNNVTNDPNSNTPIVEKCFFNGELKKGATYKDGTYTYKYNQTPYVGGMWNDISVTGGGWGVQLTDRKSTSKVTEAPCSEINGKPIVSMAYMFYQSQAVSIDLSNFDTTNVVYMNDMFRDSKASSLDLSAFTTSKVQDMKYMFYQSNAKTIDLSGDFHIRKSTWKDYIFLNSKVESIYVSNQKESDIIKEYIVQGHNVVILIK